MSTTLYAHADGDQRSEVPTLSIKEWIDYVSITVAHGGNDVVFYVNKKDDEDMDSLIGRVMRNMVPALSRKES
ncbi:hypothetical protein [Actinomycetia phage DSL-LC01]|nr:hypothetical protein [Actinomycetia phage DSL-LC01]